MQHPHPGSGGMGNHTPGAGRPRRPAKDRARRAAGIAAGGIATALLAATWAFSSGILQTPGQDPDTVGTLAAIGSDLSVPGAAPAEPTPATPPAAKDGQGATEKTPALPGSPSAPGKGNGKETGKGTNAVPDTWPAPEKSRAIAPAERSAVDEFVKRGAGISANGKKPETLPDTPDYSGIAWGTAKGELEARFNEIMDNGWTQAGEVQVAGKPRVEEIERDGTATQRVYICIDSSALEVSEPDGHVVTPAVEPGSRTALNIYELQERDGKWLVVDHLFPNDPTC